ncbi:MAG TPA: tyrosine-type recombinase/integrase [Vicinamibacteria bacterium]|nr:tyrosine-type recombinase/integrase [Vicinamibacteria bacterium]
MRFTNETIKNLEVPPNATRIDIFEEGGEGFGIRVGRRKKVWFKLSRDTAGKKVRTTLGEYPKLSLKDARKKAKAEARRAPRASEARTFADLAALFMQDQLDDLRPNTAREYKRVLDEELIPRFGDQRPEKITRIDVRAFLREKAEKYPIQANRIRSIAHRVFSWAATEDLTTNHPVAGIVPRKETKRDRVLRHEELRSIWNATAKEAPITCSFMRALMLTGLRRSEVLGAKWEHIDLEGGFWRIPSVATKSRMRIDVPLTAALRELFRDLRPFARDKTHVFSDFHQDDDKPLAGLSKFKARIEERSKTSDWRLHDIRRTVITELGNMGCPDEVKRLLLGHVITGALANYDHSSMAIEKREWLERWQRKLASIVADKSAAVLSMAR